MQSYQINDVRFFLQGAAAALRGPWHPRNFFLQLCLFVSAAPQFRIFGNATISLETASHHLLLGFPTGFLPAKQPFIALEEDPTIFPSYYDACPLQSLQA